MAVTPDQIHAASVPVRETSSGLPQFDLAQWPGEIVWMLVIFAVMLFLFSKVFVPRVGGTIAGDARRLKGEADGEAAAAAAQTAQARARAQKLALDAKTRVQNEAAASDALEQAKLAEHLAKAERQIASTRDQAMSNVRQ